MQRRSSIESKHGRRGSKNPASRIEGPTHHKREHHQPKSSPPTSPQANFRYLVNKPQAIVVDLLGVLITKSFMTSSREFREFFQHSVLEYLTDYWKQKQLKIMINFFRCSQANVPDEYKLAEREESKEDQIKQAKKHVIWKLRNDPTNSALSLFMLGITEWGYKNKLLVTNIYDEVPSVLKMWKEQAKVPLYIGVGSADFLIMVLKNTNFGEILSYFDGHMNIMDFDGNRANKDFKKLTTILKLPAEKILYLTRFRLECKKAIENGLQSLIVLRSDFDTHGLIPQLKNKRGSATTVDGSKPPRYNDDVMVASPPKNQAADVRTPDFKRALDENKNSLSLIEDHDDNDRNLLMRSGAVEKFRDPIDNTTNSDALPSTVVLDRSSIAQLSSCFIKTQSFKTNFTAGVFKRDGSETHLLKSAADLSSFGFFQRNSADDFLKFTSKMVVSRMDVATRTSIKEKNYICHAFVRVDNTAVVVVSDEDYPHKVAHTITLKILEEYPQCNLEELLIRFQDPKEADSMMKLQAELDETKIILHSTIANLLKRGEKLDDLVAKSEDLSSQSKLFYKTAKKTNRCCEIF